MKPKFLLKGAVVAMAAFGAFAFNGNTQKDAFNDYRVYELGQCTDLVEANCSNSGSYTCKIKMNGATKSLRDTDCSLEIKHNSNDPVDWNDPL